MKPLSRQLGYTDRTGLYVMVFIAMISSCTSVEMLEKIGKGKVAVECTKVAPR